MVKTSDREKILERVLAGDRRAIARLISLVENKAPGITEVLARLHREGPRAYLLGVTGPPGGGKSTLVMQLVRRFREGKPLNEWKSDTFYSPGAAGYTDYPKL